MGSDLLPEKVFPPPGVDPQAQAADPNFLRMVRYSRYILPMARGSLHSFHDMLVLWYRRANKPWNSCLPPGYPPSRFQTMIESTSEGWSSNK